MGDSSSVSGSYLDGFKGFWSDRFSFLENYTRFTKRDTPLPSWSSSDVDDFIASDPVHGPTVFISLSLSLSIDYLWNSHRALPWVLKTAREAVMFAVTGTVLGAVSTAAIAWKYSRSRRHFLDKT
ncbi:unnamed protein product [Thlaspi arvense]|uniref:Uncharacterized protein n=1 Tax=Thlaspi arvense TaxID=13288 RepID=A0AAU9RDM0_THLAR|nr:unnamed protein product [Thlaspi arvense]